LNFFPLNRFLLQIKKVKIKIMSKYDVIMPKMGESITQATITKWFKKEGDAIEEDDVLLEIATDKVDSEIPSPVAGILTKVLFAEGDVVPVGTLIAQISLDGDNTQSASEIEAKTSTVISQNQPTIAETKQESARFYSPLVKSIAKQERILFTELDSIPGTGENGRLRKDDLLKHIASTKNHTTPSAVSQNKQPVQVSAPVSTPPQSISAGDEIVEMDRMRRLIADHMVHSKHTAPHVTGFVEADVTNLVLWRNKMKDEFAKREKINLTFMPFFLEAVTKALKDFPKINSSVDGYNQIIKKNINLGVAVALPSGNLIVPVIKNADNLNITGLSKELNRLAEAARSNKLSPDDIQGGTFTITNFGSFKNSFGTPIINQPQVAILATGSIEKKPAVLETPTGDVIAIRHKMFLSLSYDHRVVDGALGGAFLRRIADYLEQFDLNRAI
jgi:2-oxoglutarate dehydrogenase E2 component (dihydrolipoamide succinyltransferase)